LDPSDPDTYVALAKVKALTGDKESARRAVDKALELNPAYQEAIALRGWLREPSP
jgi:Flp pilus assembly protein TadD